MFFISLLTFFPCLLFKINFNLLLVHTGWRVSTGFFFLALRRNPLKEVRIQREVGTVKYYVDSRDTGCAQSVDCRTQGFYAGISHAKLRTVFHSL